MRKPTKNGECELIESGEAITRKKVMQMHVVGAGGGEEMDDCDEN